MTMKKTDKKGSFGMLSVKAGIDNNPNPTILNPQPTAKGGIRTK